MTRVRLKLLTVACLAAGVLSASPATATFPGTNGKVAFTSNRDGNQEIYLMNPDGSGLVRLTNNSVDDVDPSASPDGKRILFVDDVTGSSNGIFVMNADGSGQSRLTTGALDLMPAFSPDATRIVFESSGRDGTQSDLYAMNADGAGVINLTNDGVSDETPSYLPTGRIVFVKRLSGNPEVFVMNGDGSGATNLTNSPGTDVNPSVSPDGGRVAFASDRDGNFEIYTMNIDGSGQTRLTNNSAFDANPAFSPDGTKLVFQSTRFGAFGELFVMNADGSSGPTSITDVAISNVKPDWTTIPAGGGGGGGGAATPTSGKTVVVDEVKGKVFTKCKGQSKFTRLKKEKAIPVGCEVDTRTGTVELTSAADSSGTPQTSQFFNGLFKVAQKKGKPETTLSLSGSLNCDTKKSSLHSAAKRGRRLWGRGSGRFRTKGRRGSAAVRGTYWLIEDRCDDSTLTKVKEGSVTFTDTVNKRTVIVQAGQTYVAKKGSSPNPTPPLGGGEEEVR